MLFLQQEEPSKCETSTRHEVGSTLTSLLGKAYAVQKEGVRSSILDVVQAELKNYMKQPAIEADDNPLEWWHGNQHTYPHLASYARCLLAIPATSVQSERVFSSAGNIITSQRACLSPDNANMLIFMKHNKDFYNIF